MRDSWPPRHRWAGFVLATTVVLVPHTLSAAQKRERCRWPGSMWATSANLYLDRAGANPDFEEKRNLFQKTLEVSLEGIQKDDKNAQHYARAGEGYIGLGNLVGADSMLTKAEQREPACKEEIDKIRHNAWASAFNAAVGHTRSGNTDKALDQFELANVIYPNRPETLLQMGALYARNAQDVRLQDGDAAAAKADSLTEKSIQAYRKAVEVAKESTHQEIAAFNLAQLLALNARYEEAAEAYSAYLQGNPDHVEAQTNLGVTLLRFADQVEAEKGPDAKARAEAVRAEAKQIYADLSTRPDLTLSDLRQVGAGLMALGDYATAATAFRQILEERPYDHDALLSLANTFYLSEKPDSLLPVAQKLVELYPNESNHLAFLAHAHRELGDTRTALKVLEQRDALKVQVDDLDVHFDDQSNSLTVTGLIQNRTLAPGTPVELRLELLDPEGQIVATEQVSKPAPAKKSSVSFEVKVQTSERVAGFRYSIL